MTSKTKKAIEILQLDKAGAFEGDDGDLNWTRQMGLEALERIQNIRRVGNTMPGSLLPSEESK